MKNDDISYITEFIVEQIFKNFVSHTFRLNYIKEEDKLYLCSVAMKNRNSIACLCIKDKYHLPKLADVVVVSFEPDGVWKFLREKKEDMDYMIAFFGRFPGYLNTVPNDILDQDGINYVKSLM